MNKNYRRNKLKEACEILKEELEKDISERSEKRLAHASTLLHLFALRHELPQDPTLDGDEDDYFDKVPFTIDLFDEITLLKYANNMIEKLQKEEENQVIDMFAFTRNNEIKDEEVVLDPTIEKIKYAIREEIYDSMDVGENLSIPDIINNIKREMAGQTDTERRKKTLNIAFRVVDDPEDLRYGNFINSVFAEHLWDSLNTLQKRWLIKNKFITENAVFLLNNKESNI